MRITRAAKVAAFPLTALILVALVACQGPVGPRDHEDPSRADRWVRNGPLLAAPDGTRAGHR